MARPLRVEFDGAVYHVTARGNARQDIFVDDDDRSELLDILGTAIARHGWLCHGFCLMGNHYHFLIETPRAGLSRGMRHVNGVYTQRFNRRHGRTGHVFEGRFKAVLVQRGSHLLELCRHVVLNPVRAGMARRAVDWRWSSYAQTATSRQGLRRPWLSTGWILARFGAGDIAQQRRHYRRFVAAGIGAASPWEDMANPMVFGDARFLARIAARLDGSASEVPRAQRRGRRPTLQRLAAAAADRSTWMFDAYRQHRYTLREIGEHAGLHYATVSRIVAHAEAAETDATTNKT